MALPIAGEKIEAGQFVYLDENNVYVCRPCSPMENQVVVGVAENNALEGDVVRIATCGKVIFSGGGFHWMPE